MAPRTGPRRRRRPKSGAPAAPRHFVIIHTSTWLPDPVTAHRVELSEGNLVLRDADDAIGRIIARGEWREIRPLDVPAQAGKPALSTFANPTPGEALRAFEAATESREPDERPAEETDEAAREREIREEADRRFVPSSPAEAQRILMEIERRLNQDSPDAPPAAPPRPKD